jgi:Phosphatidylinositol-4-phosphate 5-Kinase
MKLKKAEPLNLIEIDQEFVLHQLAKDSEFLRSQSIMDYSLLLAIEEVDIEKAKRNSINSKDFTSPSSRHHGGVSQNHSPNSSSGHRLELLEASLNKNPYELESESGRFRYHLAIIDYLQEWNGSKKLERLLKITFKHADPQGLSAIEPEPYQKRFMRFMRNVVFEYK